LRGLEISGLQILAELAEVLADRGRPLRRLRRMVMVMMMALHPLQAVLLRGLLDIRVVRLRRREIAGLQILGELTELPRDGAGAGRRTGSCERRTGRGILLQRGEIALRLREVSRLQILSQLQKLLLKLLEFGLLRARVVSLQETAAGNSGNRHDLSLLRTDERGLLSSGSPMSGYRQRCKIL